MVSGDKGSTNLVKIDSSNVSPSTAIEDVLNGKAFIETLLTFKDEYNNFLGYLDNHDLINVQETCSRSVLDLKRSEDNQLHSFFKETGVKYEFSKRYVEIIDNSYEVPDWVIEIRQYFES